LEFNCELNVVFCVLRFREESENDEEYGNQRLPPEEGFGISSGLMKSCYRIAAILAALTPVMGGCGGKSQDHALPEPPRVVDCQPGIPGGRFVLSVPGNPRNFNPLLDVDGGSDAVIRLLFSSLVGVDLESQQPEPGLAESWSVAPDQKTWTFKLRKNLRWSDGEPLTADDVVFTWNDVMYNPKYNQITYELFRSNGKNFEVTKVDDVTVRVVTPEVFAPFVEYFGSVAILPRHVLGRTVENGQFLSAYSVTDKPENIVGSGPFRLKSFESQKSVLLERNPDYWTVDKKGRRLPYFDEVQLEIATTPTAYQALFFQGNSAVYENVRPEETAEFQQAAAKSDFKIIDLGVGVQRDFFWFNQNTGSNGRPFVDPVKSKWFRDKRFRQAISCAINRDRIVREVYNGRAQVVYGFLSSENKKWNNADIPQYTYDPKRTRELLAGLGMTNRAGDGTLEDAEGHRVEFTLLSSFDNPIRKGIAIRVEDDLKQVGIRLNYQPVDFQTLLKRINMTMDYESASMGFGGGGLDPASQMNVLESSAPLHQWFPSQQTPSTDWERRLDALMDDQMHTLDFSARKKDFDEVQRIWAEELPMICIAAPSTAVAVRSNLGNVRPAIASGYHATWNIEELYFKK
jgi:peptide/nickel transport system substrate-binding protein